MGAGGVVAVCVRGRGGVIWPYGVGTLAISANAEIRARLVGQFGGKWRVGIPTYRLLVTESW